MEASDLFGVPDEPDLRITEPADHAAGVKAVAVAMGRALHEMGPARTAKTLTKLNQVDGFDCMSCAWPDPDPEHRHTAEFCENGAKAVAEEATTERVTPEFFAEHSVADLRQRTDYWLGKQGRITHPMVLRPGATHYTPIAWDDAFALIGDQLNALDSPDNAAFYTSGRASNEAAFVYQLFARAYGTNNLPDCSNMCHESSGVALGDTIGIGKGSVSLTDLYRADLIVLAGQNPGTNHPRMLSALEIAKRRGAKILSINPLREAGLRNFRNPQTPRGVVGHGTDLSDLHLPIKIGGDQALFTAIGSLLLRWGAIDPEFIEAHTEGFEAWRAHVAEIDWDQIERITGLERRQIEAAAAMVADSTATVWCWAMGLTQHRHAVPTLKEIVNLALVKGDIGRPGAGLCPVRGHSNVQGDRTMGIWEKPPADFLDALDATFAITSPREHGYDAVDTIRAMLDGRVGAFVALGGNFLHAAPDTAITAEALRRTALTVQISTKLNRSHLITGATALILPTLGRTERDKQAAGPQFVTVEDSMSVVHASRGRLDPASPELRSEVAIVTGIAEAVLGTASGIDWAGLRADYARIRAGIEQVVPGFDDFEARVASTAGFVLPHPPRDERRFETPTGKAQFTVSDLDEFDVPPGHLVLQTLRSHDQYNTTIYGFSDRYRGIEGGRHVVMLNGRDIEALGLRDGDRVDIVAHWPGDDIDRRVTGFRVVEYDTPRGSAAAYYPETNPLIPLDSVATGSNTPTSKSVVVRLEPSAWAG
ncbi:FdhF/YdeP family oxidoreductase [Nocardioides sp.]|uniref:FdhF/YdeP family oxidoreductase n=1 Tax=Nocardioides sp. TaxID=35761 RepID=UPI002618CA5C|nr:FdhF/YdeP family oxidoreductase [Nocardioides sp.]